MQQRPPLLSSRGRVRTHLGALVPSTRRRGSTRRRRLRSRFPCPTPSSAATSPAAVRAWPRPQRHPARLIRGGDVPRDHPAAYSEAAGVKCARRSCARRHLNCTRGLPKLRTPYRTLHTCSVLKVQYGVHNSRILSTPKTTAQPSVPLHGEPACPPPSSVGRGRLPQRQF